MNFGICLKKLTLLTTGMLPDTSFSRGIFCILRLKRYEEDRIVIEVIMVNFPRSSKLLAESDRHLKDIIETLKVR